MRPLPLIWRTTVLRAILVSVVVCLIDSAVFCPGFPSGGCPLLVAVSTYMPLVFIVLHHVLRLWAPGWWWNIAELLFCLAEVGSSASTIYYLWAHWTTISPQYSGDLTMAFFWSVLGASIFVNFLILSWDIAIDRGRSLLRQYDFSAGLGSVHTGCQWSFIFGFFTTKKRFNTDNRLIQWARGGLAILCLAALSFTVFYALIGRPLWQRGCSDIKISKVPRWFLPLIEFRSTFPLDMNVTMAVPDIQILQKNSSKPFMNIVGRLKPWHTPTPTINGAVDLVGQPNITECYDNGDWSQAQTCYSNLEGLLGGAVNKNPTRGLKTLPLFEVLITIDFSGFANTSQLPFRVAVYPAVSNSTAISDIRPVYFAPGSHLYAVPTVSFKEEISNQGLAFLGIPKSRLVPILNVENLVTDLSSSFPNNTASLRLFFSHQNKYEVEREYFEGSLLDGLARIGGMWTFMNGLFATIFGCTLLLVLFGIKPLSIYGLIHLVQPKTSLVGQDRTLSQEDRDWILEILSQHLLDDGVKASRMLQSHKSEPKDDEKEYEEAEHLVKHGSVESA